MSEKKPDHQRVSTIAPFGLRMLPELRDLITKASEESGRSMNAEIVHRLERSFSHKEDALASETVRVMLQQMLSLIFGERAAVREELRRRVNAEIAARPNDSPIDVINNILDPSEDRKMDIMHALTSMDTLRTLVEDLQGPGKKDDDNDRQS